MKQIRNVAIIAHVDHGKTTLVGQLLKYSGTFRDNQNVAIDVMDSNAIEHERGITILAKTTSINYKDYKINIVDTPGHADFAGEVERIMNMVDGVVLVVDAFEGTMPQTRFVLKKAFESHLKPIVVINKVDRPNANIKQTLDEVLNLFIELGADDSMLEFPVVYCSALKGTSSYSDDPNDQTLGMAPVLDTIIKEIPAPNTDTTAPFQFQPSLLDYNDYVGRIGIGRVEKGKINLGDNVVCCRLDGSTVNFKVAKLYGFSGLDRIDIPEADAGDIVAIGGLPDINVGETVCQPDSICPLPKLRIDEPTLKMTFSANHSPFSGRDGKNLSAKKIQDRLFKECQRDVSLRFTPIPSSESFTVIGRGELHLSVLIETLRREGFELLVSKPEVLLKTIDGVECEPYEDLQIDVPDQYTGAVIDMIGRRSAEMINMNSANGLTRINYIIPSRGLLSFNTPFMTMTGGYGVANHSFKEYRPKIKGEIAQRNLGVLVSADEGKSTSYAIKNAEERGTMFLGPGTDVYEGMIVGENKYAMDMVVTVTKQKPLNNERNSNKDVMIVLKSCRKMSLEACMDYINSDELVEITPLNIRMCKKILDTESRKKYDAHKKAELKALDEAGEE
ncbi:MAG: translational GTPase TypA [Bacilli bacterium]|jgi:GTP-binding protein|nr:translational GTPase TypA [Bacilli bacterium]